MRAAPTHPRPRSASEERDLRAALDHAGGPLLLTGAAGSGRTTALAERFRALADAGLAPSNVLAIAPGPVSAATLRGAVASAFDGFSGDEPTVTTITAAAAKLLRDEPAAGGGDALTQTATRTDRLALLLDRLDELPLRHHDLGGRPAATLAGILTRIDEIKAAGASSADVASWAAGLPDDRRGAAREREFAAIMQAHDRMLEAQGLLDHGEVVLRASRLLERREDVAERAAARARALLVDRLEDASPAELRLVELLCSRHGQLVAAIDDDPLLRSGAARISALSAHGIGGHRTTVIDLGGSRRCSPQIEAAALGAAGRWQAAPADPGGSSVSAWRCSGVRAEAQAIAMHAGELIASGAEPEQIAIVVPSARREGQHVAAALEERAIAHRVRGSAALFAQAEVRDVVAWLRLLVDPSDASAAVRALTRPPFELHSIDVARCLQIVRRRKLDMVRGLAAATESPQLPPEARDRVLLFLRQYEQLAAILDTSRPELFLHRLIDDLGLRRRHVFAAQADVIERMRGLSRLSGLAESYGDRAAHATPRDLARWLASVADAGTGADDDAEDAVLGVTIVELEAASDGEWQHVIVCGLTTEALPGRVGAAATPVPAELLGAAEPAEDEGDGGRAAAQERRARRMLSLACSRASRSLLLSFPAESLGGETRRPSPLAEDALAAAGVTWHEPRHLDADLDTTLQAAYLELRDELLADVQRIGARLGELRLDTDLDVAHGATRYLELLKVAALLARPDGQSVDEAMPSVTGAIEGAATSLQREILRTSSLDDLLTGAATSAAARAREAASTARHEPSLGPFLPRRGEGLALSASDIETYRSCPLKYKFARVLRVPLEPTLNQRFGIVIHQVLERFHQDGDHAPAPRPARPRSLEELLGLLETSWRRAGFGMQTDEEVQLWHKAEQALRLYHARFHADDVEPLWFERSFSFTLGRHTLRGRVDRVDRLTGGGYELIDYKTGRPKSAEQLRDDIQLTLYAVAAERAWDLPGSQQSYYYVLDDEKVRLPGTSGGPEWIADVVDEVAAGIEAQGFEPTPSFSACSMCDYRIACPARET